MKTLLLKNRFILLVLILFSNSAFCDETSSENSLVPGLYASEGATGRYFENLRISKWDKERVLNATVTYLGYPQKAPVQVVLYRLSGNRFYGVNGTIEFIVAGRSCKYTMSVEAYVDQFGKLYVHSSLPNTLPLVTAQSCGHAIPIWESHEFAYALQGQETGSADPGYIIIGD